MPAEPGQIALAVFELCLFTGGVGLGFWLLNNPTARARWLRTNALSAATMELSDFVLSAVLIFLTGFAALAVARIGLGPIIAESHDQAGLALVVYNLATYAGAWIAWKLIFPSLRRSWALSTAQPWPDSPAKVSWSQALRYGASGLLVALPVVSLVSMAWNVVIQKLHLPAEPQDVVAIFTATKSPWVILGMLLVACVLAPIYEELLFRAGLYRFCRQRFGRAAALVISGCCFGLLHGNWAGFVPLSILGMVLATAYEATGSIRVPIIIHGLFNLNTIILLLSGLSEIGK
jgi:membrane protease YdiL (CAAX protease family)